MAWNEPGGNNRDPWGGGNRDQGPPDLDDLLRKLSSKLSGLFGDKRGGGGGGNPFNTSSTGLIIIVGVILLIWLFSGIYIVDAGKRGVETRFGRYSDTTGPGLSYHLPFPVESVEIVDVDQRRAEEIGYRSGGGGSRQGNLRSIPQEALMLTQDENIVDIRLSVQFQIKDPRAYLFNVQNPDLTLRQVVESTVRETVGKSTMDFVLTEGRSDIVAEVLKQSQAILDTYGTGLQITNVNLQDAQPPEEVQAAFADAIKAREDEQRLKNEAEAYANEVLPRARGQAARRLEEATAYRDRVIARAEGESSRFNQLLAEYQRAPAVTRKRLYLEAMEEILTNTSTVLVDVTQGNNLFYVPLDQFMRRRGLGNEPSTESPGAPLAGPVPMNASDNNSSSRFRDTRARETR